MHLECISSDDLKHGINAFTLVCRETKADALEMNYDTIQRALRVSKSILIF
jgi:hypothetical protein